MILFLIIIVAAEAAAVASENENKDDNVIYLIEYCRSELDSTRQTLMWCLHDPHCNDVFVQKCNLLHVEETIENALAVINEKNTCINSRKRNFDWVGDYKRCTPERDFVFQKLYKLDKNANAVKLKTVKRIVEKEIRSFIKEEQDAFAVDDDALLTVVQVIKITPGMKDLHIVSRGTLLDQAYRSFQKEDLPVFQEKTEEVDKDDDNDEGHKE